MDQEKTIGRKCNFTTPLKVINERYIENVAGMVCQNMRLSLDAVRSKGRARELVKARSITTKICIDAEASKHNNRQLDRFHNKGWTLVGNFFGRDHSCAFHWNKIANQDMADADFKAKYYECLSDLNLLNKK